MYTLSYTLQSRMKSLAWRAGMMVVALLVSFALENAVELQIPGYGVVVLGLVAGEVSKYLNRGK